MRKTILIILIVLCGTNSVKADLVFDSGHNIFDDSDPYYDEVWVINDAVLDAFGGEMGKLGLMHYATANIYGAEIELLSLKDNTIANIYDGSLDVLQAYDNSLVYLYAYNVTFHPLDGYEKSWVEGTYYINDKPFELRVWHKEHYSHVTIVPEPNSLIFISLGFLFLRRKM